MDKQTPFFQIHPFSPIFDKTSQILILGSFPSVKSRETDFYYGHPQNRFWPLLSLLFKEMQPISIEEKKFFLQKHHIALWDVVYSCEISGSSDQSIHHVIPNDMDLILKQSPIRTIYANGNKAFELYQKYIFSEIPIKKLPSTSPANAAFSIDRLKKSWIDILN